MKRHLLVGTLLAVTLSCGLSSQVPLTDLQGHALNTPRPIEALDALRVGGGSAPTPNQSYLAKQMQTRIAACIASVVQEVSNYARVSPSAWQVPDNVLWKPIGWRIQNQHFDYRPVPGQGITTTGRMRLSPSRTRDGTRPTRRSITARRPSRRT